MDFAIKWLLSPDAIAFAPPIAHENVTSECVDFALCGCVVHMPTLLNGPFWAVFRMWRAHAMRVCCLKAVFGSRSTWAVGFGS